MTDDRDAIAQAIQAEREACCRDVCEQCAAGRELVEYREVSGEMIGFTHEWTGDDGKAMMSGCFASSIHMRAAATKH